MSRLLPPSLVRLARTYGVQVSYIDMSGRLTFSPAKSILRVLQTFGSPVSSLRDVPAALRERKRQLNVRRIPPVRVAWEGKLAGSSKRLPFGYHRRDGSLIISSPRQTFQKTGPDWGPFLPLYALHSKRNPGAGDFTDLKAFALWAGRQGAGWVGTLPLLSQFLDRPFEPSPYSPASRLFWNEFWLDLGKIGGMPAGPWVDYRRQMKLKLQVLEKRAKNWKPPSGWLRKNPDAAEYARFRGSPAYLYGQWLADRQLEELQRACGKAGVGLYFDLPLGVHPKGYDAWKERESFVQGMNVGAPPDTFFTGGQDWGFRPMHPEKIRERGYDYFIRSVRQSMRYASMLRVDHIMGLHRLFWVPEGRPAKEGVYVRYHAEEMYAVLCVESHRNRCAVVGEDLGIVPPEVRRMMRRRGLARMFVVQYEMRPGLRPLRRAPPRSLASLNTHDMPPFSDFWAGWPDRQRLLRQLRSEGWLRPGEGEQGPAVAQALLRALASGPAESVLVNLEDLWGERRPHNVPGTSGGKNWRRKARYSLEQIFRMKELEQRLQEINRLRSRGKHA